MDQNSNLHRVALTEQLVTSLNRYSHFVSKYKVSFSMAAPDAKGLPLVAAKFQRTDDVPFAESTVPMDQKFAHLKDQTVMIRPFYMPMMKAEFNEAEANDFSVVDFDYAAILGYNKDAEGNYVLKTFYFPPADAFLDHRTPDEDGVFRKIPLPTYRMHQMSLDPRQKFARFLYLAERFSEALEYQYDKYGFFFSNP